MYGAKPVGNELRRRSLRHLLTGLLDNIELDINEICKEVFV